MPSLPDRSIVHPYRNPGFSQRADDPRNAGDPFEVAVKVFLAAISLVRACLDVSDGRLTVGGVEALSLVCFAFHRSWI